MAGNPDSLLADSEMAHRDEIGTQRETVARPSEFEERAWLVQQQDPDTVMARAFAYRLGGWPDIARLVEAVRALVRAMPDLNVRYRFDEDGALRKSRACDEGQYLEVVSADSRREAIQIVLGKQAISWNLDCEPPFKLLLILGRGDVVLALLAHRILDEACPPEEILSNLARAYNGEPLRPGAANRTATLSLDEEHPAPLAWLRRADTGSKIEIADFASPDGAGSMIGQPALRCGTEVDPQTWDGIVEPQPAPSHLLATVAVHFARFLCHMGGHERIGLALPRRPEAHLGDYGLASASPDLLHVTVERDRPVIETVAQLRAQLEAGQAHGSSERKASNAFGQLPLVQVTWLTDPSRFLAPKTVIVERLPLPTLEARPDIELAVGLDGEGRAILELTTGQAVSPHAGPLLLDRFLDFMRDAETAGQPAASPAWRHEMREGAASTGAPAPSASGADTITAVILAEFREALAAPEMQADDDFFDHGGHSLIATRIIGRLLDVHGIEVHFNELFSYPTAAALARHARRAEVAAAGSALVGEGSSRAPLSLAQMSLWKAYAAFGFNEIFNLPFALEFLDPVDEHAFECAFTDILERHSGLRTLFIADGDDVYQQVVPMHDLPRYKWFWPSRESEDADRGAEARYHFDLARELPIRLRFMTDPATGRQMLSFLFHHIVLDEWSVNLMMDELAEAYRARAGGNAPVWSAEPAPFHEFARQQAARGVDSGDLAYWTDMLRDAPSGLPIFENEVAVAEPVHSSPSGGWVEFKLAREVTEGLYALAKENSSSLFNVSYAAIAATLNRLGGIEDLVVGTSASGRTDAGFFDTVGYFTTVVAHRVRVKSQMTVGDLVASVKNTVNESMPHTEIPIDLVEEALGMTPGKDHLFEVFIQIHSKNKLNGALPTPDGRSIAFRQVDPDRHESLLGLHFEVMEEVIGGERSIRVLMSYRADHYSPEQVELIRGTASGIFALFSRPGVSALPLAELEPALATD